MTPDLEYSATRDMALVPFYPSAETRDFLWPVFKAVQSRVFPYIWDVLDESSPWFAGLPARALDEHKHFVPEALDVPGCPQDVLPMTQLGREMTHAWWRHQMETFSALLAICAGNSPVPGEFPAQRPVTRSFDVFFDLRPNKRLNKQSWGWWFETLSCSLWRHCNGVGGGVWTDGGRVTPVN